MMSVLTISGSSARVVGPLLLAKVYSEEGPILTIILSICFVLFGVIMVVAFYKRLVPYSVYESRLQSANTKESSPSSDVSINADQSSST